MGLLDWAEKQFDDVVSVAEDYVAPVVTAAVELAAPVLAPAVHLAAPALGGLLSEDDGLDDSDPEVRDAVRDARAKLHSGLFDTDEDDAHDAKAAVKTLVGVDDEKKRQLLNAMKLGDVETMIADLPPEDHGSLGPLIEHCSDAKMKLKLFAAYHKAKARSDAQHHPDAHHDHLFADEDEEEAGEIPPDSSPETLAATRRKLAAKRTGVEIDEEVEHLLEQDEDDDGEPLTLARVNELMARKSREHELEMNFGINLTNDTQATIDDYEDDGDEDHRERRVWSKEELDRLESQLALIPAEHRSGVKEFRRASVDYTDEGEKREGVLAQAHWSDGMIEIFDSAAAKSGGVLIHEIGHNVDRNHQGAQAEYKKAVGWQDFGDEKSLRAQLAAQGVPDVDAELTRLAGESGKGGYGQQAIEIGGKVYQRHEEKDDDGKVTKVTFSAYNADAIPRRGEAQATTGGWQDEWDYGRTGPADLFADHYKLAARDPARLHQDMVAGPERQIEDLDAKIQLAKKSGGDTTALEAEKARAETKRDTLKQQFDIMRTTVYGVDEGALEDFALEIDDGAQADLFREQAARCSTPAQLEKLMQLHREGKHVDDTAVDSRAQALPADKQAAFYRDAASCATPEQLDKLVAAYQSGRRDSSGAWVPGKNSGEDTLLGF